MRKFTSDKYPGEVFTVEGDALQFQAVYPAALAEKYASLWNTEADAWLAIFQDAQAEGLTLREVVS